MSLIIKEILPLIITLFLVIIILYSSYIFTKFIGKRSFKLRSLGHMKIVDKLAITHDKSVVVLKADKKFYLLSVSTSDVRLIDKMDEFEEDSASINEENFHEALDFKSILMQGFPKKK